MAKHGTVNLGDKVKDTITGMQGVVVAVTNWLNGCQTLQVQPKHLKDGIPTERVPLDVEQVEVVAPPQRQMTANRTGGAAQSVRSGRE